MSFLQTSGLGKDFGKLVAVHGLDLSVEEGEIFGFLGPNGAGKTTAISMLAGVVTPSRGTATIGGHDVRRNPGPARRMVGLVTQEIALYEDLTARQNLAYFGSLYRLSGRALDDAITWALQVADLADRAREPVDRFSGGMKRRLNLAAGLIHRPKLLICDEPTVGVDPQSRARIFDTLRALRNDHGMTVIYTSHYMEEVEALCSRIAIIDHGKLVALDTLDRLLRAHAKPGTELEIEGDSDRAAAALAVLGPVAHEGAKLRIGTTASFADIARVVEATGAHLRSLRVARTDLETVFLNLTGRELRDAS